jgi:hypothetical protein
VASPIAAYIVVTVVRRAWQAGHKALTISGLAVLMVLVGAAAVALYAVPEVKGVMAFGGWSGSSNPLIALVLAVTDSTSLFQIGPNLLVTAGLAAGIYAALARHSRRWLIMSFTAVTILYVGAVAKIKLLEPLTGLFYSYRTRLGPLLAVAGVPLMLWGLDWVISVWRRPGVARAARRWIAVVGVIGLASAVALAVARPFRLHLVYYDPSASGAIGLRRFFDDEEFAMMQRLAGELEHSSAVLGDPGNGSAFLYSLIGQPVVFTHLTGRWDEPRRYLLEHFADLGKDPKVCDALDELGVDYVYLDSRTYNDSDQFAALTDGLDIAGQLELIDQGGTAALYRITGC